MDIVLSATVGELASRSISFLIDRYSRPTSSTIMEERLHSLQRLLIRVRMVVEEAEGRCITNQAMLQQLELMRKEMYRGYYTLDTIRDQSHEPEGGNSEVSHPFILSRFNPAKRLFLSTSNSNDDDDLQLVLHRLSTLLADAREFVVLLTSCPPLCRQPYSMYLFLDRFMFGRQIEMQRVISFLLHKGSPGMENIGVLPIIGPYGVGKSTLIAHVCHDERVRNRFSRIVFFSEDDLKKDGLTSFKDGGVIKHENNDVKEGIWLIVITVAGHVDEVSWRRLYLASTSTIANNSKIFITSQSYQVLNFGTMQPLILNFLPKEAYWYFFKVLAFGSVDPREHPKLAAIAMKMVMATTELAGVKGSFLRAYCMTNVLRSNLNVEFWSRALASNIEHLRSNLSVFNEHPGNRFVTNKQPIYVRKILGSRDCLVYSKHTRASEEEIPSIKLSDIISGRVKSHGRFEALAWKSNIPPYNNYIVRGEVQKRRPSMSTRKKQTGSRKAGQMA